MIRNSFSILFSLMILLCSQAFGQHRIISLAPSLTQNLYLLDVEDEVLGYTSYCEMAVHSKKQIVATAVKVNLEKVVSLQPDIIVATTITSPETIKQLKQFGIRVEVYPTPNSFNDLCEQFQSIGTLVSKKDKAQEIISECKLKVDSLTQKMSVLPPYKMLFQIGANPLYCVPPGTFMSDFIRFSNGKNISDTPQNGNINRESVVVRNPDVIFLTAMGIVGQGEKSKWEEYPEMSAITNNRVFILDANKSCSPTPISFVETLDTIANLLLTH